jgi:chromosomal replication initiation ATPase DnaA
MKAEHSTATVLDALTARDLLALLDTICQARGVTREALCGRGRTKTVALARQELWWRLRRHPGMSYDEIARLFDRNRTTIMGGVRAYLRAVPEAAEIDGV